MRSGSLRHRVTLQKKTQTEGDRGGVLETWEDWKTVWAAIEPLRGDEYWSARQFSLEVTHRITIRYLAGVDSQVRVKFSDREFHITSIQNPGERNEALVLMCNEVV